MGYPGLAKIDPIYALPVEVLDGLPNISTR